MELITVVATYVGYVVLSLVTLIAACYIIAFLIDVIEFKNNENYFCFAIFRFGLLYAKKEDIAKQCNDLTKSNNKRWFVAAPMWFNKHVYNFGIKK